jgi:hypothetical protein
VFRVFSHFSLYVQILSVDSQYTNRFILHIQRLCIVKFHSKIYLIPSILRIRTDSLWVFSVYERIYSTYSQGSQYTYRFVLCIRRMRSNNIKYSEWNLFSSQFLKGHYFKKQFVSVQLDSKLPGNNLLFCSSFTKKIPHAYYDNMRNDLQIQIFRRIWIVKNYLG